MTLYTLSFAANALITFSVAAAMLRGRGDMENAFGPDTPARRILACVYLAIGGVSIYALIQIVTGQPEIAQAVALTLFPLQITYKLLTAYAVGPHNPVVRANLAVVALLAVTLLFGG